MHIPNPRPGKPYPYESIVNVSDLDPCLVFSGLAYVEYWVEGSVVLFSGERAVPAVKYYVPLPAGHVDMEYIDHHLGMFPAACLVEVMGAYGISLSVEPVNETHRNWMLAEACCRAGYLPPVAVGTLENAKTDIDQYDVVGRTFARWTVAAIKRSNAVALEIIHGNMNKTRYVYGLGPFGYRDRQDGRRGQEVQDQE